MYQLYEVIAAAKLPALFHTGQTAVGQGAPGGGGGIRLKYGNPIYLDDVAVDFPDMPIIMAHPSFPWQDEALAVALHKAAGVYRSVGLVAEVFSAPAGAVLQYAAEDQSAVRVGPSDDHHRSLAGGLSNRPASARKSSRCILKENAARLLGLRALHAPRALRA